MKVKDCMIKEVMTVSRSTTLAQLIETFRKYNYHTLPVVEKDNRLVGLITFEDIMKVFQPYSSDLARMLKTVPFLFAGEEREEDLLAMDISADLGVLVVVDDIMNTQFATIDEEASIARARSLMKLHEVNRLPVVKDGRLVGIISLFDIILAVFKEKGIV